jgi:hypothetical protein
LTARFLGEEAKSTDPTTWATRGEAESWAIFSDRGGVGIVLGGDCRAMETASETIAQTTPRPARRPPAQRSRVGNGKVLLPMTDGRSLTARRFQDLYEDIANDLGGLAVLSEAQKQLIRRVATLSAESERQEAEWAKWPAFRPDRLFDYVELLAAHL